jgi:PIN domain nuclease of toxin-antitoxin system
MRKICQSISAWEIALKMGTGKLNIDRSLAEFYRKIYENGFVQLGAMRQIHLSLTGLPLGQRDPFEVLSKELQMEFPGVLGFSTRNLRL